MTVLHQDEAEKDALRQSRAAAIARLETNLQHEGHILVGDHMIMLSIAISLKRIADALEALRTLEARAERRKGPPA
jgi:hypothetical protein